MSSVHRRRNDDGQVSWQCRWRDPEGNQRKKTFRKKVDAERFLTGVGHSQLVGSYVDPSAGRVTVGDWAQSWIGRQSHLKPKTLASYESLLRSRLLPRWATVPVAKVTHSAVVGWVSEMRAEGLSASRCRQAYHLLSTMLDDVVKDGRLARNAAAGVELPRLPIAERRYLTHDQVDALADACGASRTLVLLLAYCGLRWGEATALRVRRVDRLRGRLEVVEAVADVNGRMVFGTPKAHQVRSVPIPRFLRDDLARAPRGQGSRRARVPARTLEPCCGSGTSAADRFDAAARSRRA